MARELDSGYRGNPAGYHVPQHGLGFAGNLTGPQHGAINQSLDYWRRRQLPTHSNVGGFLNGWLQSFGIPNVIPTAMRRG